MIRFYLANYEGATEDKIEFDNSGTPGRTEHLHTLKLLKQKEIYKWIVFGKGHPDRIILITNFKSSLANDHDGLWIPTVWSLAKSIWHLPGVWQLCLAEWGH